MLYIVLRSILVSFCPAVDQFCQLIFCLSKSLQLTTSGIKEIREGLIGHLSAVLGHDRLAAEYMLLHLLSKVYILLSCFLLKYKCIELMQDYGRCISILRRFILEIKMTSCLFLVINQLDVTPCRCMQE